MFFGASTVGSEAIDTVGSFYDKMFYNAFKLDLWCRCFFFFFWGEES